MLKGLNLADQLVRVARFGKVLGRTAQLKPGVHRQRFIPILENGGMVGVITRTDLLNLLISDPAHLPKETLNGLADRCRANIDALSLERPEKKDTLFRLLDSSLSRMR